MCLSILNAFLYYSTGLENLANDVLYHTTEVPNLTWCIVISIFCKPYGQIHWNHGKDDL